MLITLNSHVHFSAETVLDHVMDAQDVMARISGKGTETYTCNSYIYLQFHVSINWMTTDVCLRRRRSMQEALMAVTPCCSER